jgi:phosphoglycerol transferase MdoB-like AlkP superfamily enzyme
MLLLLYLSFLPTTPRAVAVPVRVLAFVVFVLYVIDGVVMVCFNTHLTLGDALDYADYAPRYISQIGNQRGLALLAAGVPSAGLCAWLTLTRYTFQYKAQHAAALLAVAGLLTASCFTGNQRYAHAWKYKNFIAYSLEIRSESRGYSDAFVNGFDFQPAINEEPKPAETPNIIIVSVESLSSYQSRYFSGLNDWTPNLDRIAANNVAYTGFCANGFCTNDCYISVLTGRPPIRPPASSRNKRGGAFDGFEDIDESLPRILAARGYATDFLMSADLAFGDVGPWAESAGFDHIEGHTHPAYDGWARYQFDAAPDEALYQRVCERIKEHGGGRFFMYLSTISSHHPFVNPENGEQSEVQAVRYADRQLGLFHDRLIETGFFDDGVLIIFGDHHAMVPLKPGEAERFGEERAAARVPLVVSYGNTKQAVRTGLYQQTDIFNSLKNLTCGTLSTSDWAGDIFADQPAKYVVFRRGDYRNHISVFTDAGDYTVKLDGEDTRIVQGAAPSETIGQELVARINAARIPPRPGVRTVLTSN